MSPRRGGHGTTTTSLVTGGAGFVGAHLVRLLGERGDRVRVLDLAPPERPPANVEYVSGSVTDREAVRRAVGGTDRVFHLAANPMLWARDKSEFARVNAGGTREVLAAARAEGVGRLVHCSTDAILEPPPGGGPPALRPSAADPRDPYCRAKFLAETEVLDAAARGAPVVVVSPAAVIGPGDRTLTPPARMLLGFLNGDHPAYLDTALTLVDARDVAEGHVRAAERGRAGERYVLGGDSVRLRDLLALTRELTGAPMPRLRVPYWLALTAAKVGELAADHVTGRPPAAPVTGVRLARDPRPLDTSLARRELGVHVRPLRDSLADTIRDLDRRGLVRDRGAAGRRGRW